MTRTANGWHLLVTARGRTGPTDDRGVVGHCWSPDLRTWEVRPPLSEVGQGFGQLEVMHTVEVEGQPFLLFSCLGSDLSAATLATGTTGGIWAAKAETVLGPYDIAGAQLLADSSLYVGRLVQLRDTGAWRFLAFDNVHARRLASAGRSPTPAPSPSSTASSSSANRGRFPTGTVPSARPLGTGFQVRFTCPGEPNLGTVPRFGSGGGKENRPH